MRESNRLVGIILNSKIFRENDRIISFYTKELGKIEILVRSARKIVSKLAPLIAEPFVLVELTVAPGQNFYHLVGGRIKKNFKHIFNNYTKIIKTSFLLKRIDELVKLKKAEPKIFALINKWLEEVNKLPEDRIEIINSAFLIKLLSFLGYQPELKKCLICGKTIDNFLIQRFVKPKSLYFNFQKGGVVCLEHGPDELQVKINFETLKILQNFLYRDFNFLEKQKFNPKSILTAKILIKKFLSWHTG